jgi:hypothetical protein
MNNIVSEQDHLSTALQCAEEGFPVFPVAEGGRPLTMRGTKDATTDPAKITAWWAKWPKAHIGIVLRGDMCTESNSPQHLGDVRESSIVNNFLNKRLEY